MARAERAPERLNTPGRRRRSTLPTLKVDRDAFGKFAEGFARFMGTARFLVGMTVIIVLWVIWNVPFGPPRPQFDRYPFIFLTLMLSLQASYTFTGRSIGIVATRANNRGRFEVRIDGGAPTVVDLFNGALQPRRIVFQRALAAGSHTITVRVLGQRNAASTANRVDLDGFVVLN